MKARYLFEIKLDDQTTVQSVMDWLRSEGIIGEPTNDPRDRLSHVWMTVYRNELAGNYYSGEVLAIAFTDPAHAVSFEKTWGGAA